MARLLGRINTAANSDGINLATDLDEQHEEYNQMLDFAESTVKFLPVVGDVADDAMDPAKAALGLLGVPTEFDTGNAASAQLADAQSFADGSTQLHISMVQGLLSSGAKNLIASAQQLIRGCQPASQCLQNGRIVLTKDNSLTSTDGTSAHGRPVWPRQARSDLQLALLPAGGDVLERSTGTVVRTRARRRRATVAAAVPAFVWPRVHVRQARRRRNPLQACASVSSRPGLIDSAALLAQCAFRSGAGGLLASAKKASKLLPASQQWLQGSDLVLTHANASQFDGWFQAQAAGVVIGGRSLDKWEEYAGENDKLPVAVCGTGVSPRALHDQIYAQYPAMKKNNPWGA